MYGRECARTAISALSVACEVGSVREAISRQIPIFIGRQQPFNAHPLEEGQARVSQRCDCVAPRVLLRTGRGWWLKQAARLQEGARLLHVDYLFSFLLAAGAFFHSAPLEASP